MIALRMNRKDASRVLTLMALTAIGVFIWRHREELTSAAAISPFYLVLCALSTAGYLTADGLLTYVIVRRLGGGIRLFECLSLSVTSTGTNILMPVQLGTVGRALYLKQHHNFDYSAFLATIVATQVLVVIVSSMYAAAALAWMLFVEHRPGLGTLLAMSVFCLVISVLACFLPRLSIKGHWILNRITEVADQFYCLRAQPAFLAYLGALAALKVGGVILAFWTACAGIGVGLSFVEAAAVESLGTLATIINVTPGSIGIYEAVVAFVGARAASIIPAQIVMAALVLRGVLLVMLLILTPLGIYFLRKQVQVERSRCAGLVTRPLS
jgi:uncharacterized membrane protein YbhN (UPF0104 family)